MPRNRTQKQLAKRVDTSYFRRMNPIRSWRRGLALLCSLAAAVWIGISAVKVRGGKLALSDTLHNPGHVTAAHKSFESDCRQCHAGEPASAGGAAYTLKVTDAACLKCHDGAMHAANMKVATWGDTSLESHIATTPDANHPGGALSAGCANCHVEHRGEAAMMGRDNSKCIVCHQNIKDAMAEGATAHVQNAITAFAPNDHPRFGRKLVQGDKWFDATKLKFNHKAHFEKVPKLAEAAKTCTLCHNTQPPTTFGTDLPPFSPGGGKTAITTRIGEGGYMRPISYAEHCSGCHAIAFDSGFTVSHVDLGLVRGQLADAGSAARAKLAALSPEDRDKALTEAPAGGSGGGRRRGAAPAAAAKKITPEEYVTKQIDVLKKEAADWAEDKGANLQQVKDLMASSLDEATKSQSLLEAYVAMGVSNSCAKCHDLNGGALLAVMTSAPTTAPSTQPVSILATLPTGIPNSPRHWFPASSFNHTPHRSIACVDCHKAALESGADTATATADVLSPDMDRFAAKGKDCIDCHKPGGDSIEAATGACISCHVFHDRSKERSLDPTLSAPTTQPAPTPVAQVSSAR
jgi:hypothetical protein